jgi:hypothetical protein
MTRSPSTFELVFVWGSLAVVFLFVLLTPVIVHFQRKAKFNEIMRIEKQKRRKDAK